MDRTLDKPNLSRSKAFFLSRDHSADRGESPKLMFSEARGYL
jgi:hypothetical protein